MKLFCSKHECLIVLILTMPFLTFSAEIILPSLEFPVPTGQYKVGTTYMHFLDKTRPETLTKAPGDFRELEIQAWYPAKPGEKNVIAQYWRNPDVIGPAVVQVLFSGLPQSLGTIPAAGLHKVAASGTHSYLDAPVEDSRKIYSDYSRAFFDKHLQKKEVPLLDGPSKQYPEVIFTLRNPEK